MELYGTNAEQIERGLKELSKYKGASGTLFFLPAGSIVKNMVISEWQEGKFTPVQVYEYPAVEIKIIQCQETQGVQAKD